MEIDGLDRQYFLHMPASLEAGSPLVFVLHGYGGSAETVMGHSNMNQIADENAFAVCYPQGSLDESGNPFWNVGFEFHEDETVDDLSFLTNLAQHLQNEFQFSSQNTFSAGMSNGGGMSYILACQAPDIFRGVASVSGVMMETVAEECSSAPVPVLSIHGTDDDVILWDGDMDNNLGWGAYLDAPGVIELWAEQNACTEFQQEFIEDVDLTDGSEIMAHFHTGCQNQKSVWLYEVIGGGHDWPGTWGNMDIDSSTEIWGFFSQFMTILGDVNQDDSIDILDVVATINLIIANDYHELADMNEDGTINVLDSVVIVGIIVES